MAKYLHSGRTELRKASIQRFRDATCLQAEGRWRGAMYLRGYVIECRLKEALLEANSAWNLEQLETVLSRRHGRPISLITHQLNALLELSGAGARLANKRGAREYRRAFGVCLRWTSEWRYAPDDGSEEECRDFFEAAEAFEDFIRANI